MVYRRVPTRARPRSRYSPPRRTPVWVRQFASRTVDPVAQPFFGTDLTPSAGLDPGAIAGSTLTRCHVVLAFILPTGAGYVGLNFHMGIAIAGVADVIDPKAEPNGVDWLWYNIVPGSEMSFGQNGADATRVVELSYRIDAKAQRKIGNQQVAHLFIHFPTTVPAGNYIMNIGSSALLKLA